MSFSCRSVIPRLAAMVVIGLVTASNTFGLPVFGPTCVGCHQPATERMEVLNFDAILDPGTGPLKTFIVEPGSTVQLTARVLNGANAFGVRLRDLGRDGVNNPSNQISFVPDPIWIEWGMPPFYITSEAGQPWSGTPVDWDFNMLVSADTPPDFYRFDFAVSGSDGNRWTQSEAFYVMVVPEPSLMALTVLPLAAALLCRRSVRST